MPKKKILSLKRTYIPNIPVLTMTEEDADNCPGL